jgi:hypothetical protein
MQRIEALRHKADMLEKAGEHGPPAFRREMRRLAAQWRKLAAEAEAMGHPHDAELDLPTPVSKALAQTVEGETAKARKRAARRTPPPGSRPKRR